MEAETWMVYVAARSATVSIPLVDEKASRKPPSARGPRVLIDGSDHRLGLDLPKSTLNEDVSLVMGGFQRIYGSLPLHYLSREMNDVDPIGYKRLSSGTLDLLPGWQKEAYKKLGERFRFKDAKSTLGKGSESTTKILRAWEALGLIRKLVKEYEKLNPQPERAD